MKQIHKHKGVRTVPKTVRRIKRFRSLIKHRRSIKKAADGIVRCCRAMSHEKT